MEEAIRALLVGDAAVAALIGDGVFLGQAPENAQKPYLVLSLIGGEHDYHLAGASGLKTGRLQGDAWAADYSTAKTLARAATAAVSGYQGTVLGTTIQGIFIDAERDGRAEDPAGSATFHRVSFDASVWHC